MLLPALAQTFLTTLPSSKTCEIGLHRVVLFLLEIGNLRPIVCQVEHARMIVVLLLVGEQLILLRMQEVEKVRALDRVEVLHVWLVNSGLLHVHCLLGDAGIIHTPANGFELVPRWGWFKILCVSGSQVTTFLVEHLI